jgi:hypothetical protein
MGQSHLIQDVLLLQSSKFRKGFRACVFSFPLVYLAVMFGLRSWASETYWQIIEEDHLLETLQVITYFLASIIAAYITLRLRSMGSKLPALVFLGFCVMLLGVALEEISWGQRFLGFSTPEAIRRRNVQEEIILHNMYVFKGVLNSAWAVVGFSLAFAWLVPRYILGKRWRWMTRVVPDPSLMMYFLPVGIFYLYMDQTLKTGSVPVLKWYEQEVVETLIAVGLLLFTSFKARE